MLSSAFCPWHVSHIIKVYRRGQCADCLASGPSVIPVGWLQDDPLLSTLLWLHLKQLLSNPFPPGICSHIGWLLPAYLWPLSVNMLLYPPQLTTMCISNRLLAWPMSISNLVTLYLAFMYFKMYLHFPLWKLPLTFTWHLALISRLKLMSQSWGGGTWHHFLWPLACMLSFLHGDMTLNLDSVKELQSLAGNS